VGKVGLVALILGLLGVLLGGGTLLVSLLLPTLTDGRTSWDEAMFGIIPGALLLCISFVVAVVGLVLMIMKRRKQPQAGAGV
jgi:Na+-transporting NADH:ubiquinone oxidoreductase subunit NqrD